MSRTRALTLVLVSTVTVPTILSAPAAERTDYAAQWDRIENLDHSDRVVPEIPPTGERIRCVIDSDTATEIDDVWAVALALLCPERFEIEGFVGANFDDRDGGPTSMDQSVDLLRTIMEKAGVPGRYPVHRGAPPMRFLYEPSRSDGVDFIIERAMASTPEDPLWVIGLGSSTDMASALLLEPRIAERVRVFWHFRTKWPEACYNFNVFNDPRAARVIFHSNLPFVLFDTGTYLTCPMEDSKRWVGYGALGKFLHEYRLRKSWYQSPKKGFYDVGDIAALIDPALASWEVTDCPTVDRSLKYNFKKTHGKILRCYDIDRDRTYEMYESKLKAAGR